MGGARESGRAGAALATSAGASAGTLATTTSGVRLGGSAVAAALPTPASGGEIVVPGCTAAARADVRVKDGAGGDEQPEQR